MKIEVIPFEGPIKEEIEGLQLLAARLPVEWFAYANCELAVNDGTYVEIDVLIVADDRVFLIDLKAWRGTVLADEKGRWFLNGRTRGGSAARKIRENAKKAGTLLRQKLNLRMFVDAYVLFSASADFSKLPEDDLAQSMSIEDFCDPARRAKLIASIPFTPTSPLYQERDRFELRFKFKGGPVRPRTIRPLGFELESRPIWVHPSELYREYLGTGARRDLGIIRVWDFSRLPLHLQHENTRDELLSREQVVRDYLAHNSEVFSTADYTIERRQSEDCYELYELPRGMMAFADFLGHTRSGRSIADVLDHVRTLLSVVAELHRIGVAHCDLASHSIWLGPGTRLKLSHLASAHIPDSKTLGPTRELLIGSGGTDLRPPFKRDVIAVAPLMLQWVQCSTYRGGASSATLAKAAAVEAVLAAAVAAASNVAFEDARQLAWAVEQAANEAVQPLGMANDSGVMLQKYFRDINVAFTFSPAAPVRPNASGELTYESHIEAGRPALVKIFSAFSRSSAIDRLLPLLPSLEKLKRIVELRPAELPLIVDFGLAYDGLFVCYEKVDGTELTGINPLPSLEERLQLASTLCQAVSRLHDAQIPHGDLSTNNVLIRQNVGAGSYEPSVVFIDAFDVPSAGGRIRVATKFAPTDYESTAANERDAFALAKLICEVLNVTVLQDSADWTVTIPDAELRQLKCTIEETLSGGWREPAAAVQKLSHHVRNALDNERSVAASTDLSVPVHGIAQIRDLERDGDRYYVQLLPARSPSELPALTVSGLRQSLMFDVKVQTDGSADFSRARLIPVKSRQLGWLRNHADQLLICKDIRIHLGPLMGGTLSTAALVVLDGWHRVELERSRGVPVQAAEPSRQPLPFDWDNVATKLSSQDIWEILLNCERSVKSQVRVGAPPYQSDVGVAIPVNDWRNIYTFDDRVQVFRLTAKQEERSIGSLMVQYTRSELLMLDIDDPNILPAIGEQLILRSERDEAVRERKCASMERILASESPIHHLLDAFDSPNSLQYARGVRPITSLHSEDWLKARYGLNDGQASAMVRCVSAAPLFLIQGPPGTGKTKLIGSLVHYLVTQLGYRNILVASQTHEAVNNAAGTIGEVFTENSDALDLVRAGKEEDIADDLLGVSTAALRTRFVDVTRATWRSKAEMLGLDLGLPANVSAFVATAVEQVVEPMTRVIRTFESSTNDSSTRADAESAFVAAASASASLLNYSPPSLAAITSAGRPSDFLVQHIATASSHRDQRAIGRLVDSLLILRELLLRLRTGQGDTAFGEFLVRTNAVVCGTCVGIGLSGLRLRERLFDWVIIDEASRCTAAELAVPVQTAKRVILVGDHLQLPPFIPEAMHDFMYIKTKEDAPYYLASDFERIFRRDNYSQRRATLTEQYRMVDPISRIVSKLIYEPRGIALTTRRGPEKNWVASLPVIGGGAVHWIDTSDQGDAAFDDHLSEADNSFINRCEAKCVAALVDSLLNHEPSREQLVRIRKEGDWPVGVICTYAAQVLVVEDQLRRITGARHVGELVRVGTVDSYQGRENAIVIVSLVRTNPGRRIGFLTSLERSNVALSRAQERLVLVGDGSTWGHNSNDQTTFGRTWHYMRAGQGSSDLTVTPAARVLRK